MERSDWSGGKESGGERMVDQSNKSRSEKSGVKRSGAEHIRVIKVEWIKQCRKIRVDWRGANRFRL